MNLGVIAIIVIFQPELRRGLEQLGTNKFTKFFGIDEGLNADSLLQTDEGWNDNKNTTQKHQTKCVHAGTS